MTPTKPEIKILFTEDYPPFLYEHFVTESEPWVQDAECPFPIHKTAFGGIYEDAEGWR